MKKNITVLMMSMLIAAAGCDQYWIFRTISEEEEPKTAKIAGTPSKIVQQGTGDTAKFYTANGQLWICSKSGDTWAYNKLEGAPNNVRDVAYTTSGSIYVLTLDFKKSSTAIWKYDGTTWSQVCSDSRLKYQAIYGAGNNLFACTRSDGVSANGIDYVIEEIGGSNWKSGVLGFLTGVTLANNYLYFATRTTGLLYAPAASFASGLQHVTDSYANEPISDKSVVAVLSYPPASPTKVVAVAHDGYVYQIQSGSTTAIGYDGNKEFTGALAYWEDNSNNKLILASVKIDSLRFGYGELVVGTNSDVVTLVDSKPAATYKKPGVNAPTSCSDEESYTANMEVNAVTSMVTVLGTPGPLIFASTARDGVWSYRQSSSTTKFVWNRED